MAINVGKANVEAHAQTQEELQRGDKRYWTPADGKNQIRIMPPPQGVEEIYARVGFHYQIGPDDKMFACPKSSGGRKKCFLCDEAERLSASDDEDDQADAKELKVTKRFLVTIVDLAHPQDLFKVWAVGVKLFRDILYYFSDADYGDISDLEDGFNLNLVKTGSGLATKYNLLAARNPSNFLDYLYEKLGDENYSDELFNDLPDLSTFLTFDTDAEMEAAFNGASTGTTGKSGRDKGGSRRRDADPEDERPRRGRGGPAFEDEAEEGEEAEEPEPAPRGRRGAAAAPEAEPEPEPARRGRPSAAKPEAEAEPEEAEEGEEPEAEEAEPEPAPRGRTSGRTSGRTAGTGRTSGRTAGTGRGSTGDRLRSGLKGNS